MRIRALWQGIGAASLCVTVLAAQDALTAIGMRPADAKRELFGALSEGRVVWYSAAAPFKAASADARVTLVNGVLGWAKEFTESSEFATRYASLRKGSEPRVPATRRPAEEELARQQADLDRRIEMEKKGLEAPPSPRLTPEAQAQAHKLDEERLKGLQARRATFDNPDTRAQMRTALEAQAASEQQQYQERRAQWEDQHPADARTAIAKRLRQFVDVSGSVDFNAKLVPCRNSWSHHSCFANPEYEKKPAEWKLLFRAGKQPVEAARTFAATWLAELEKQ